MSNQQSQGKGGGGQMTGRTQGPMGNGYAPPQSGMSPGGGFAMQGFNPGQMQTQEQQIPGFGGTARPVGAWNNPMAGMHTGQTPQAHMQRPVMPTPEGLPTDFLNPQHPQPGSGRITGGLLPQDPATQQGRFKDPNQLNPAMSFDQKWRSQGFY